MTPGTYANLAVGLLILAECLGRLGQASPAGEAAAEALTSARSLPMAGNYGDVRALLGWLAGLAGDTAAAEDHFTAAGQIHLADAPNGDHLYSFAGVLWAEWLARTGREGPARDSGPPQRRQLPQERLERGTGPV